MKYDDKYLMEKYGITNLMKELNCYAVPLESFNTNDDTFDEGVQFYNVDLDKLVVEDNDTIVVTFAENVNTRKRDIFGTEIEVSDHKLQLFSVNNMSEGSLVTSENLTDDGRYYILCKLAEMYKDKDNITFEYHAWYTEEEMEAYVDRLESYVEL